MSANKGVTPICDYALPKCEFLGCLVNSQVEHLCHCHTQSHNPSQVSSVRLSSWGRPLWLFQFSSVQFSHSVMSNSATPWTEAHQVSLSITNSRIHVISVGDAIQPSHPLSSPSPPALNLSSIRVFSNESPLCIRWPKYWNFNFNITPSNEHLGLISF